MRHLIFILPMVGLAACAAPGPQATPTTATAPAVAFDMPMDPGLIRCQQLSNPTAMVAATDWAMGQARANVLSGRSANLPDATVLAGSLATYCSANSGDNVRTAIAQLGV